AAARVDSVSYFGSRTVVVSENGNRVFWNGGVFDADLHAEWTLQHQIYAASADGRYAFSDTELFDIQQRSFLGNVPASTPVKAFNSVTAKLVYRGSNSIAFYRLNSQEHTVPAEGSIIPSPAQLEWQGLPVMASYRVYLGTSSEA